MNTLGGNYSLRHIWKGVYGLFEVTACMLFGYGSILLTSTDPSADNPTLLVLRPAPSLYQLIITADASLWSWVYLPPFSPLTPSLKEGNKNKSNEPSYIAAEASSVVM